MSIHTHLLSCLRLISSPVATSRWFCRRDARDRTEPAERNAARPTTENDDAQPRQTRIERTTDRQPPPQSQHPSHAHDTHTRTSRRRPVHSAVPHGHNSSSSLASSCRARCGLRVHKVALQFTRRRRRRLTASTFHTQRATEGRPTRTQRARHDTEETRSTHYHLHRE